MNTWKFGLLRNNRHDLNAINSPETHTLPNAGFETLNIMPTIRYFSSPIFLPCMTIVIPHCDAQVVALRLPRFGVGSGEVGRGKSGKFNNCR